MQKVALGIAAVWTAVLISFFGYVWWTNNQPMPQEGNLGREVEQVVFWGTGQTAVTITHAAQPNLVCPPQRRAANIVLLVDKSSSMVETGIDAFSEAVSAAEAFVAAVDLDKTQVAIAFFDTDVSWASDTFSQDREIILENINDFSAGGQTDIANALNEAGERVVSANPGDDALPVIVLLSDGADDPTNAQRVAQLLREEGVRIVTIALGLTGNEQLDFLEGIASSPNDAYESVPAELQGIYSSIAEEFNSAIALNVTYSETVNPELAVVSGSQQPDGVQNNNQLQWQFPGMTSEGASFSYVVSVAGYGRYPLNPEESYMSYIDCVAGPVVLPLMAGPDLLALPGPLPAALIAFLPFLIPVFLMFFGRKPKQEPLPPPPPPARPAPEPVKDLTPAWLKRLTNTAVLAETQTTTTDEAGFMPTVIVGLGETGRTVLNQIARTLRSQYGGRLPEQVRLLQIDIQPKQVAGLDWQKPRHLADDEWVVLTPDLKDVQTFLQKDAERNKPSNQYLNWYEPFTPSGRMQGRMSVFYDLRRGSNGSVLWNSLHKTVHRLDKPKIKVVGAAFDDGSSGLLIDVARLTQIVVSGSNPAYSNIDVELWLTTPVGQDWSLEISDGRRKIRRNDQIIRTMATLRELERFQRNARQPFAYVSESNLQDQLRSTTHSAVVQTIFLFEPRADVDNVADHLNTMADGLMALLHTPAQQSLTNHLTASQLRAGTLANQRNMGTACSLGAYAVRLPLGILEEAVAWRTVYDLLFEELMGLQPSRQQQPNGLYSTVSPEEVVPDDGRSRRQSAEELVEAFASNLNSRGFMQAIAHHVNQLLNGEIGTFDEQTRNRRGGLLQSQRWLESVRSLVQREGERDVARQISDLTELLKQWQEFLNNDVEPFVQQQLRASQVELAELAKQKGRQWILDEALEWKLYQQRIRGSQGDYQTLARAARRFGWQAQYKEKTHEWQLDFLAPPVDFVWQDDAYLPEYVVEKEATAVAETVFRTAVTLTQRNLQNETVLDAPVDPRKWYTQAEPGFTQKIDATQSVSSDEIVLFVAPEAPQTDSLRSKLESGADSLKVQLCATPDHTAMTVLRVQGHMPLNTYKGYDAEAWSNNYVDPNLYVWRGEQLASQYESQSGMTGRLDAKFVGWIQLNQELLNLFCEGYIYGLWDQQGSDWYLPGLENWPGNTLGDALDNLFGGDSSKWPLPMQNPNPNRAKEAIAELKSAIQSRMEEIAADEANGGRRGYLRKVRKEMLPPLTKSADTREQSFALYLSGFLGKDA